VASDGLIERGAPDRRDRAIVASFEAQPPLVASIEGSREP
jgi:hypothetical protein